MSRLQTPTVKFGIADFQALSFLVAKRFILCRSGALTQTGCETGFGFHGYAQPVR